MKIPNVFVMTAAGSALLLGAGCQTPRDVSLSTAAPENGSAVRPPVASLTQVDGSPALLVSIVGTTRTITFEPRGTLTIVVYPMRDPVKLLHLLDTEKNTVRSADEASAFIDILRQTEGPVDFIQSCTTGVIGRTRDPEVQKVLAFLANANRQGDHYLICRCFGAISKRDTWPKLR